MSQMEISHATLCTMARARFIFPEIAIRNKGHVTGLCFTSHCIRQAPVASDISTLDFLVLHSFRDLLVTTARANASMPRLEPENGGVRAQQMQGVEQYINPLAFDPQNGGGRNRYKYHDRGDGMYDDARKLGQQPHLVTTGQYVSAAWS